MHSDSFIIAYSKIKVNHTEEHHRKQRGAEWKSHADKLRKIIYFQSNNTAKLQRVTLSPADDNRFSLSNEINHALPLAGGLGGYSAGGAVKNKGLPCQAVPLRIDLIMRQGSIFRKRRLPS